MAIPISNPRRAPGRLCAFMVAAKAAAPPPPPPAPAGGPVPIGTVVQALPAGCVPAPIKGVAYQDCGGNFYRAAFQGNNLVYVVSQP